MLGQLELVSVQIPDPGPAISARPLRQRLLEIDPFVFEDCAESLKVAHVDGNVSARRFDGCRRRFTHILNQLKRRLSGSVPIADMSDFNLAVRVRTPPHELHAEKPNVEIDRTIE